MKEQLLVGQQACVWRSRAVYSTPTTPPFPPRPPQPPPCRTPHAPFILSSSSSTPAGTPATHLPPLLRPHGAAAAEAEHPRHQRARQAAQGGQGASDQAFPARWVPVGAATLMPRICTSCYACGLLGPACNTSAVSCCRQLLGRCCPGFGPSIVHPCRPWNSPDLTSLPSSCCRCAARGLLSFRQDVGGDAGEGGSVRLCSVRLCWPAVLPLCWAL